MHDFFSPTYVNTSNTFIDDGPPQSQYIPPQVGSGPEHSTSLVTEPNGTRANPCIPNTC